MDYFIYLNLYILNPSCSDPPQAQTHVKFPENWAEKEAANVASIGISLCVPSGMIQENSGWQLY